MSAKVKVTVRFRKDSLFCLHGRLAFSGSKDFLVEVGDQVDLWFNDDFDVLAFANYLRVAYLRVKK